MIRKTLLGLCALASAACTSSSGPTNSCAPYDSSGFNATTPTVSFRNDIVTPIFRPQCGLSASCHQLADPPQSHLYLGTNGTPPNGDEETVYKALVGKPSVDLPSMNRVTVNDPKNSFLMHKLDGDLCVYDSQCNGQSCLLQMPQNADPLESTKRDTIRRWIAQGAPDN